MENGMEAKKRFCLMSGESEHKLDVQRRIAVPADWRSESPTGRFVLIPGRDRTLQLYTEDVFQEKIMSRLARLSPVDAGDLQKMRALGANTYKLECDKQGRIQLPQKLTEYAGLGDKVSLIGSGDFGQIMDAARRAAERRAEEAIGDGFLDILK